MNPDGVFLSNGPGDPDAVSGTYTQVEKLLGKVPVFGICLGHQMMSKAAGAQIEKLKFGHRGGNHPVMNLRTHRVEITAQNHGFGLLFPTLGELIPEESAGETEHRDDLRFWVEKRVAPVVRNEKFGRIQLTHVNLNDGTAEGIAFLDIPAFSVQYHPEASPGPTDAHYLFTAFSRLMDGREDYLDIDIAADRLAGWKFGEKSMPKRTDIKSILVIGSGPIVIGQACEFDYSGAQACKVLKADGYRVILVNSNPATIMTDPGLADRTYVEPITPEFVEKVIEKERPDALLPTLGGQTGLNTAVALAKSGVLDKYGVEMVGCDLPAIERGEDRKLFNECMEELGIEVARSGYAYSMEDAESIVAKLGFPVVCRPSFTLGGAGGGIAHDMDELHLIVSQGLGSRPQARCSSRNPSRAGKSTRWRSCATAPATASSCALSRTSTRWASTPATRSPSPLRKPSPMWNTSACARPRSPSSRRSASKPVARTCSSPSTRRRAA